MAMQGINSSLLILCTSVFIVMLGVGIIGPILPLYAEHFGASYFLVGMVVSSFGLARLFADLPAGSLADTLGRRPLMLAGLGILSAGALVAAFASNVYHLMLARLVQGAGSAFFATSAMALLVDIAPRSQQGRYMSYYQGSFFLGTAVGPSIGGFLAVWGLRAPFFALACLSLVSAVFVHIKIAETLERQGQPRSSLLESGNLLREVLGNREVWVVGFAAVVLFILNSGVRMTAIPLYGANVANLSPVEIGAILSFAAFSGLITLTWSGSMIDKVGTKPLLVAGFLMAAASSFAFIFSAEFFVISAVALVFGMATGIVNLAQASAVVKVAHPKHAGLSVGVYRVFCDIGIISGPVVIGVVADYRGLHEPFLVAAVLCILAGAIAHLTLRSRADTAS